MGKRTRRKQATSRCRSNSPQLRMSSPWGCTMDAGDGAKIWKPGGKASMCKVGAGFEGTSGAS